MINTMKPASTPGHDEQRGETLERLNRQYGKPEEKQREAVKKLGKDEFFKIMVAQIQHQDPLKPAQNEQMAAEMAQFSSLEQMMNVNKNLEALTQAQQPLHNLGAAGLIGKYVTADSSHILHTDGKVSQLNFELPVDATDVHFVLLNDKGQNIRELETKNLKKGPNVVEWDGKTSNNMPASSGSYMMTITATTERGKHIQVQTAHTAIVHGVAFEGKETILLTGDIRHPERLMLKNVSRVVDPGEMKRETPLSNENSEGALSENGAMGAAAATSAAMPPVEVAALINQGATERPMDSSDGPSAGQLSKFASVDAAAIRGGQEKPLAPPPPLGNDEIRKIMEQASDLTSANPVGQAMREGRMPDVASAPSAPRQAMPSGSDGSTVGKWGE